MKEDKEDIKEETEDKEDIKGRERRYKGKKEDIKEVKEETENINEDKEDKKDNEFIFNSSYNKKLVKNNRILLNKKILFKILQKIGARDFMTFCLCDNEIYKYGSYIYDLSIERAIINNNLLKECKKNKFEFNKNYTSNNCSDLSKLGKYVIDSSFIDLTYKSNYESENDIEIMTSSLMESDEKFILKEMKDININDLIDIEHKNSHFINFSDIFTYRHFKKYNKLINWVVVSKYYNLNVDGMIKFYDKLSLINLLKYQKIKPKFIDFIINNKDKLRESFLNNNNKEIDDNNEYSKNLFINLFNYLILNIKNIDKSDYKDIFYKYKDLIDFDQFSKDIDITNEELIDLLKDNINWYTFLNTNYYGIRIFRPNINIQDYLSRYIIKYRDNIKRYVSPGSSLWNKIKIVDARNKYDKISKGIKNGNYDYFSIAYIFLIIGGSYLLYRYKIINKPIFYIICILSLLSLVYNLNTSIRRKLKNKNLI